MDENDILSAQDFAKCAGIHYNTVRKMIKKGRINAFKIGVGGRTSDWRIPKSEIQRISLVSLENIVNDLVSCRIEQKKSKDLKRFFVKVEKTESCWLWKGALTISGYGVFSLNKKYIRAHRASYILHKGEIKDELLVLHSCDVRNCVNPDHLHLGTPKDNMEEMIERKRARYPRGEDRPDCKLTDEQVREIRNLRKKGISGKEIAIKFKISLQYVYEISWGKYRNYVF